MDCFEVVLRMMIHLLSAAQITAAQCEEWFVFLIWAGLSIIPGARDSQEFIPS
jgi:hypothetical protein